jgi:hypothetical protein
MNVGSVFPDFKKTISPVYIAGLIVGVVLLWAAISFGLALGIHYPLTWFGCEWSNYWGWVVLVAVTPFLRIWSLGNK